MFVRVHCFHTVLTACVFGSQRFALHFAGREGCGDTLKYVNTTSNEVEASLEVAERKTMDKAVKTVHPLCFCKGILHSQRNLETKAATSIL